jgi:hypothetical protein
LVLVEHHQKPLEVLTGQLVHHHSLGFQLLHQLGVMVLWQMHRQKLVVVPVDLVAAVAAVAAQVLMQIQGQQQELHSQERLVLHLLPDGVTQVVRVYLADKDILVVVVAVLAVLVLVEHLELMVKVEMVV